MGCWCLKRPNVSVKRSQASNYFAKVTEPKTRIRSILLLQLLLRYINNTWTKASRQKPITAYPFPGLRSPKTRINLQDIVPNDFFTWNLSSSYVTLAFGDMSSSPWSLLWRVDNILGRPRKKSVSASGGWSKNGLEKSDNLWGWCGKDWRDSKGWKNDFSKSQKDFCLCSIQSVKLSLPPDKPLLLLLFNEVVSLKELSFDRKTGRKLIEVLFFSYQTWLNFVLKWLGFGWHVFCVFSMMAPATVECSIMAWLIWSMQY